MEKAKAEKAILKKLIINTAAAAVICAIVQLLMSCFAPDNDLKIRLLQSVAVVFLACLSLFLWLAFAKSIKQIRFSFIGIFFSGAAIWVSAITIFNLTLISEDLNLLTLYSRLVQSGLYFMFITIPAVFAFAIFLIIGNVMLLKNEGFRKANIFGIGIALLMIIGEAIIFLVNFDFSGSELMYHITNSFLEIYTSVYVLLECFLFGSIICSLMTALHKPSYDKDFVIILGCGIKKDGTLYPLIKGRVDKAIEFAASQESTTGKKITFIPSGGKGTDEIISESEAMTRYLLEQGIERERIIKEDKSVNTRENMLFSKNIINEIKPDAKAVFSTSGYHVLRSGIISRDVGFYPDGMGKRTKWYFWPNAFVREVVGMLAAHKKVFLSILLVIIIFFISFDFLTTFCYM